MASPVQAYLSALIAHDPSSLRLSPNLKATENAQPATFHSGLWKTATKIGPYTFTCDDKETNQHVFLGLIYRGPQTASITAIRIKLDSLQQIEESEIIVAQERFP